MTSTLYRIAAQESIPAPYIIGTGHDVPQRPEALAQELSNTAAWIVQQSLLHMYPSSVAPSMGRMASVLDDLADQVRALEAIAAPAMYDDAEKGERRGHISRQLHDLADYTGSLSGLCAERAGMAALRAHIEALADAVEALEDIAVPALCEDFAELGITVKLDD